MEMETENKRGEQTHRGRQADSCGGARGILVACFSPRSLLALPSLLSRCLDAMNTSLKVQTRMPLRHSAANVASNTLGFKFIIPYYEG